MLSVLIELGLGFAVDPVEIREEIDGLAGRLRRPVRLLPFHPKAR